MGRERLVDKTNKPVHPLSVPTALSPFSVTNRDVGSLGFLPIGVYRNQAAFWDLDKAVNQPLVEAEKQYILGILDGREEGRDLLTQVFPADDSLLDSPRTHTITVPFGEVWFIHAVRQILNAGGEGTTGRFNGNWRCSLWPSREDPINEHGQAFWDEAKLSGAGTELESIALFYTGALGTQQGADAFVTNGPVYANKDVSLRLPPGAKITWRTTQTVATDAEATATLTLYGYVGKLLVA